MTDGARPDPDNATHRALLEMVTREHATARNKAAKAVGWPALLRLEEQGVAVVPNWMPEMMAKYATLSADLAALGGVDAS